MKKIHKDKIALIDLKGSKQYWVKPKSGEWFVGFVAGKFITSLTKQMLLADVEEIRVLKNPDELHEELEEERESYWTDGAKHGCDCI